MLDLARYRCQLLLPGFSEQAQQLLQDARVLLVGAGGLGCPASQYLAAIGVGTLGIADADIISMSNLHRQILYFTADAGKKKAIVACQRLQQQNPTIRVIPYDISITSENVLGIIQDYDILVDCSDNFETRYLLNDACVISGKPLIYGAIYQFEGQVAVWNIPFNNGMTPNYRDVFPSVDPTQIPKCSEGGVMPTIAGIIGCMQANEVVKLITKQGELLAGKMFILDVLNCESRIINIGNSSKTIITELEQSFLTTIEPAAVKQMTKNRYRLIDVRSAKEREASHIGGEHIPLNLLLDEFLETPENIPVILYCETGKRSAEGAKALSEKYPGNNYLSLKGGMKSW